MNRLMLVMLAVMLAGAATAKPTYDFKPGWNSDENNDLHRPGTNQRYMEGQIRTFLESKKNPNGVDTGSKILATCGYVEIQKGCHQPNDRHVTIYADPGNKKNQTTLCVKNVESHAVHVNGC